MSVKQLLKVKIRGWSLWLEGITSGWVLPENVWTLIDDDNLIEAKAIIVEAEKVWDRLDPEILRARGIIVFLE